MNWNYETIFKFTKRSVDCCFVDELIIFIGCKEGRIYTYDMVSRNLTAIYDLIECEEKLCKNMDKEVKIEKIYKLNMKVFN